MQNENLTGSESLKIIESMINKAKNQFSENGHLYLLWGWAVFICSIAQFVMLYFFEFEYHYMVWFSMWLVAIYQTFYLRKMQRRKRVKTYTDDIIGYVWLVFVFMMFLFGFLVVMLMDETYYRFINPGFLALYGMPTILSGIILRFRPLVYGGVFCWVLSASSPFIPPQYQILLLALAMAGAWIIPGYILRSQYKKNELLSA